MGARSALCALLAAFLLLCASGVAGSSAQRQPRAQTTAIIPTTDIGNTSSTKRTRVTFFLADNSLVNKIDQSRPELSGRLPGASAARAAAVRSPKRRTAQESRIAAMMDDQRNAVLPAIRSAARSGTLQSERIARAIERVGGRVESATPLPNTITAVLPASAIATIASSHDVTSVVRAKRPELASSPIDGSETWHTAGFTGGGSSADGNGGPDYVAFDTGVRTNHTSFRTRLPGDCSTCVGTGPTRVISPAGRTDFSGSEHGNQIAATVAATDLTTQGRKGQAYGLDKLYDPYWAENPYRWNMGVTYNGEPGVNDLPEVVNYSAGIYEDFVDNNPSWGAFDASVSQYGIAYTISAGNCGVQNGGFTGCNSPGEGPHRVSTPATNFNVISVGGLDHVDPFNQSTWFVWANSSPGPTYGGRKKPDLIAVTYGVTSCPNDQDDATFENCGSGTSYAAPQAASGVALLASVGVYAPTAQKAILINSATPIQGQTYWMPRSGWGALNLDGAFQQRANYSNGAVTQSGANSARFYRLTGVTAGDRTTLVWNRRLGNYTGNNAPLYSTLTNLDLAQFAQADACSPTCTPTATGGVDASDSVDTDQTVTADNPMPGNGSDGSDNVEQIRSTGTGTQIVKVKAMSTIDGATSEPFSIASARPVEALSTPIPSVDLQTSMGLAGPGQTVTITATVSNPSDDLALSGGQVTLSLPAGTSLISGSLTQSLGTIAVNGTAIVNWQVSGATDGTKHFTADASGTTYGETFAGSGQADFDVDATPPALQVDDPGPWAASSAPTFNWSATDAASSVVDYDVELSRNGGAFTSLLTNSPATSTSVTGAEGEQLRLRIRARDTFGNLTSWSESSTSIDATPPEISVGPMSFAGRSSVSVPVSVSNVGSTASATYAFASGPATEIPLAGSTVSYTNYSIKAQTATLRVTATDELGRAVTAVRTYSVPSRYLSPSLKLSRVKSSAGRLTISGRISASYAGRVTITIKRRGRAGTKRVVKRVRVKRGRFVSRVSLKPGSYTVRATAPPIGDFLTDSATKRVRVR